MLTSLLFSALILNFAATAVEDFPEYKEPVDKVYKKLEAPEEKPKDINKTFRETLAQKSNEVSKFIVQKRDELLKSQKARREELDAQLKKELAEWRAANPKLSASAFMKEQGERRKALVKELNDEKNNFEARLKQHRSKFDEFVSNTRKDFSNRYKKYVEAYDAAKAKLNEPDTNEFKEIPKGQGTVLSPEKDSKKQ